MNAKSATKPAKKSETKNAKKPVVKRAAKAAPTSPTKKPTPKPVVTEQAPAPEPIAKVEPVPAKPTVAKPKKLGCIDAAAQVLAASKVPMTSRELIAAMAAQNLWTSPAGQTPHATLYSAILREIGAKGAQARFVKTERGKFAAAGVQDAA